MQRGHQREELGDRVGRRRRHRHHHHGEPRCQRTLPVLGRHRSGGGTRALVAAGLALTAVGVVLLVTRDPNEPGTYPPCPLRALTGLECPGCGTLRALHAVLHGDLGAAWRANPLTVLALPLMVWALGWAVAVVVRGRGWRFVSLPRGAPWVLLAALMLYWAGRNIIT